MRINIAAANDHASADVRKRVGVRWLWAMVEGVGDIMIFFFFFFSHVH